MEEIPSCVKEIKEEFPSNTKEHKVKHRKKMRESMKLHKKKSKDIKENSQNFAEQTVKRMKMNIMPSNTLKKQLLSSQPSKHCLIKEMEYLCKICNLLLTSLKQYRKHCRKEHGENNQYDKEMSTLQLKDISWSHPFPKITDTSDDVKPRKIRRLETVHDDKKVADELLDDKRIHKVMQKKEMNNPEYVAVNEEAEVPMKDKPIKELMYACELCNVLKKSYKRMRRHYSKCHEEISLYECNSCKFLTHDKIVFQEHLAQPHQDISEAHQDIAEILPSQQKAIVLNQHEQTIDNSISGDQKRKTTKIADVSVAELGYECKICNVLKKSYKRLRRHYSKCHEEISLYECNNCKFLTHNKTIFHEHLSESHQNNTAAHQDISEAHQDIADRPAELSCKQKTKALNQAEQSIDKKSGDQRSMVEKIPDVAELGYECKICSVLKKSYKRLRRHYSKCHEEISLYECNSCKFLTHDKIVFQEHLAQPHQDISEAHQDIAEILPSQQKVIDFNQVEETTDDCLATDQRRDDSMTNQSLTDVTAGELKYKCSVCSVSKTSHQQLMRHSRKRHKEKELLETQHSMSHPLSSSTETMEDLKPDGRMGLQGGQERHYIKNTLLGQEKPIDFKQVKQCYDTMGDNLSKELKYKCSVCSVSKTSHQQLMKHSRKRHKENELLETQHSMSHPLSSSTETREDLKPDGRIGLLALQERHYINNTLLGQEEGIDLYHVKKTSYGTVKGNQPDDKFINLYQAQQSKKTIYSRKVSFCKSFYSSDTFIDKMKVSSNCEGTNLVKRGGFYKCLSCEYRSEYKKGMLEHIKIHTHGGKLFKCPLCRYAATFDWNLTVHMMIHTSGSFQCEICDYSSKIKANFLRHIRSHTGEKPYKCPFCNHASSTSNSLTVHIRRHTNERPFQCDKCEYNSNNKSSLIRHIRSHTGEKPYKCPYCNYSSTTSDCLTVHIRTHTNERPFQCEICDYRSKSKMTLVTHIRTHTGEKPFKCVHCSYCSSQKGSLKRHELKKHGK
ncbi:zinc finger protein 850-like [Biomphalaria glabrata]|uniref:Zinc finger protein 850-like n=1 Tax=Biomphalaria glabrata TaxID=6526 RepID=A0A9W2Z7V5_BIOGL|nr:zinc finger protein 850-like [Biomphalaria glabrata]XP_055871001.1 zinc finger protein 850-like [Biomphalaria glabrata]